VTPLVITALSEKVASGGGMSAPRQNFSAVTGTAEKFWAGAQWTPAGYSLPDGEPGRERRIGPRIASRPDWWRGANPATRITSSSTPAP
jgi:hypothetical protein